MPEVFALDSFALLSYFLNQVAARRVEEQLIRAERQEIGLVITSVNLGEVIYRVQFEQGPDAATNALTLIHRWRIDIVEVSETLALEAAKIKAERRIGYLDCFVVALAQRLGATVVTGDPDFHRVEDLVPIEWLER